MSDLLYLRRKLLGLTQLDLCVKTGICERSIRKLENNEIKPNLDTLMKLSCGYKLHYFTLVSFNSDVSNILEIDYIEKIFNIPVKYEHEEKIQNIISEIKSFIVSTDIESYEYCYLNQYLLYLCGLDSIFKKNYIEAFNFFEKALKITINEFNLNELNYYLDFLKYFTKIEIKILYALSTTLYYLDKIKEYECIIDRLVVEVISKTDIYCEILCQKSIVLSRKNKYNDSINYINKAIDYSKDLMYYKNLPLYYFNRGVVKSKIKDPSYSIDIAKSLELSKSLGLEKTYNSISKKCKLFNL